MADKIVIEIDLQKGDVKGALSQIEKELSKVSDNVGKTFASNFKSSLSELGSKLKSYTLLAAAASSAFVLSKSISSAIEQEEAVTRLNTALKISGDFSQQASSDLQSYASQLQATTRFGDELILNQIALAKSFGATNEQAKQIAGAATDLADALGISLESATRNISKTLGGLTGELGEAIPALRTLTKEQLQAGGAIKLLSDQFGGTATSRVNTFKGATDQLSNAIGDTLEGFGQFITQNPLVIDAIKTSTGGFLAFADALKTTSSLINGLFKEDSTKPLDVINAKISETRKQLNTLIDRKKDLEGGLFGVVFESDKIKAQQLSGEIQALQNRIQMQIQERAKVLQDARAKNAQEIQLEKDKNAQLLQERLASDSANIALVQNTSEMIVNAEFQKIEKLKELRANNLISEQMFEQARLQTRVQTEAQLKALEEQRLQESEISLSNLYAAFQNNNRNIKYSSVELAKTLQGTFAQGFGNAFQQIGASLKNGTNAMESFTQAIGQMFSNLASQAGDFYIAKGLALLADPMTTASGAKMISAGAGLKVLTGLLGAGGGGSSSPSGGAGGGAEATQTLGDTGIFQQQDIERQKPSTNVEIVVQGSLVQQEELGKFIADTLTEVSDKQGININKAYA